MNIKDVYILDDRAILYLNGEDTKDFLQNLISNDINKINEKKSCFTSLLSPQGKFLYEFIIIKHKSGYLIDCEKSQADGLFKQLSIYKLRSKVEILNLSNEFVVAAFTHEKFLTFEESQDLPGFTLKYREDPIFLDPRNKYLGARLIINLEKLYLSLKKLDLLDSNMNTYASPPSVNTDTRFSFLRSPKFKLRNKEQYGSDSDNKSSNPERVGLPTNYMLPESSLGTLIKHRAYDNNSIKRMVQYNSWHQMPYKERSLYNVFNTIAQKCEAASLPKCIIDESKILYKSISNKKR